MSSFYKTQAKKSRENFSSKMQKNAAVLTVICIMLCLTCNYTFPLHREIASSDKAVYANQTKGCDIPTHHKTILERTKKMSSNIEQAFKRIRDSTQDFSKNIFDRVNGGIRKDDLSEEDLRQYEQLVILKKYPYLDLKELEIDSPGKNPRQSLKSLSSNFRNDPSICESIEEAPNVEITNRGLSGFAIPPHLTRFLDKSKLVKEDKYDNVAKFTRKSSVKDLIGSLSDDVKEYVETKHNTKYVKI